MFIVLYYTQSYMYKHGYKYLTANLCLKIMSFSLSGEVVNILYLYRRLTKNIDQIC